MKIYIICSVDETGISVLLKAPTNLAKALVIKQEYETGPDRYYWDYEIEEMELV